MSTYELQFRRANGILNLGLQGRWMRLTVSDVVSPSYFVAIAAVELGFFAREGLDVEFVWPPPDSSRALIEGEIDLYGASPYVGFMAFPEWRAGKLLCALAQGAYWVLAVRADIGARRGDFTVLRGLRLLSSRAPALALAKLLQKVGLQLERDAIEIVTPPVAPTPGQNLARQGAQAILDGVADGFWGNALRAEYAVRNNVATVLADIRYGDGPGDCWSFTFPALVTTDKFVSDNREAVRAVVGAIINTQRALKNDATLAMRAARRLFPAEEVAMISEIIKRDSAFYEAAISRETFGRAVRFAQDVGLITTAVPYEYAVVNPNPTPLE